MKSNEFKCAKCGNIYEKARSDEEARKECEEIFGVEMTLLDDVDIICDDCYKDIHPSNHPKEVEAAIKEFRENLGKV